MRLLLNTKPLLHSTSLETWDQWLATLDADEPRSGRIVTAVRFDGVDEPAFRSATVRSRRLDASRTVEVETASRGRLIADTLTTGAAFVTTLAESARTTGQAYRQDDLTAAHALLPQLIDGIRAVVTLTDQCAAALAVPRQAIVCHGVPFDQWMDEFGRRLAVLIDAHGAKDWPTAADSLEYEIAPALGEWVDALNQLAELSPPG